MRYLFDIQILVWMIIDTKKIPQNINRILKDTNNDAIISTVSIWEIAIKISIGKLSFPFEIKNIIQVIQNMNISIMNISSEHIINVAELPFHHKDLFDRLIISQEKIENLSLISSDNNFKKYDVKLIW